MVNAFHFDYNVTMLHFNCSLVDGFYSHSNLSFRCCWWCIVANGSLQFLHGLWTGLDHGIDSGLHHGLIIILSNSNSDEHYVAILPEILSIRFFFKCTQLKYCYNNSLDVNDSDHVFCELIRKVLERQILNVKFCVKYDMQEI